MRSALASTVFVGLRTFVFNLHCLDEAWPQAKRLQKSIKKALELLHAEISKQKLNREKRALQASSNVTPVDMAVPSGGAKVTTSCEVMPVIAPPAFIPGKKRKLAHSNPTSEQEPVTNLECPRFILRKNAWDDFPDV